MNKRCEPEGGAYDRGTSFLGKSEARDAYNRGGADKKASMRVLVLSRKFISTPPILISYFREENPSY